MIQHLKARLNSSIRVFILREIRKRINTPPPSVVCNNCTGAMVLHEYGLQFCSPFVNLWIPPKDYLYLLHHLKDLVMADFEDITGENLQYGYPVGLLGGKVHVHFMHYHSFEEAVAAWKRRTARMDFKNLRIIYCERDNTTIDILREFDKLPYTHKVAMTHLPHPELKSVCYIKGFSEEGQLGNIFTFSGWFGKQYYDQFDWVKFFFEA